jgi:hypothetical protein
MLLLTFCVPWGFKLTSAFFRSVTSTYANLLSGRTESNDAMIHMGKVVTMVNSRLKEIGMLGGGNNVTEGLIGAVASIALAEVGLLHVCY